MSKDSLRITGGSYAMDISGHGLSGQDEVSIATGTFDIIAGKDGIHAETSEDAELGFVYLENGTYRITASGDGISASGNCTVVDGDYTITTGGGSENGQQHTSNMGFGGSRPGGRPVDITWSFSVPRSSRPGQATHCVSETQSKRLRQNKNHRDFQALEIPVFCLVE